jgi:alpha-beta hydrolase superfamily lysophospholipase
VLKLRIDPVDGLIDVPAVVSVTGATVGAEVVLNVRTTDAAGTPWSSTGTYRVGDGGVLKIDDPDQPWWDMRFGDPDRPPVAFAMSDDALTYTVSVSAGGEHDALEVCRRWATGPKPETLDGDGWRLQIYRPADLKRPAAAVILIPGTTGPGALSAIAALLASRGYVTGVVIYMGEPGLPESLRQVPAEIFHDATRMLSRLPEVDAQRVAVYAVSVGAMGAAYAFSLPDAPPIAGLVLVAGANVMWQALTDGQPPKESAFAHDGSGVPYVPIRGEKLLWQVARNAIAGKRSKRRRSRALTLLPASAAGLSDQTKAAAAAIAVERISCPVLTISGGDDAMWPASAMARQLHDRRRRAGYPADDLMLDYPEAGHFFRPPATPTTVNRNDSLVVGGTPAGSAHAQRQAWAATLGFLAKVTG